MIEQKHGVCQSCNISSCVESLMIRFSPLISKDGYKVRRVLHNSMRTSYTCQHIKGIPKYTQLCLKDWLLVHAKTDKFWGNLSVCVYTNISQVVSVFMYGHSSIDQLLITVAFSTFNSKLTQHVLTCIATSHTIVKSSPLVKSWLDLNVFLVLLLRA